MQGFFLTSSPHRTMSKYILIITRSDDLHADLMEPVLAAKGGKAFRINLDQFPRDYTICQAYLGGQAANRIRHLPSGAELDLADVGSVWSRKPAPFAFLSSDLSVQERAFATQETEQALFGLLYTLDCYWMSHPVRLRGALWKGEQLQRAIAHGFRVPASIVTNSSEQVRAFRQAIGTDMIFKALSTPSLGAADVGEADRTHDGLGTTLVTAEMMDSLDAVDELPCHFQEYIPKQYELRVTIVGDKLFAAKIHSQDDERTAIDSRDMSAEILYEATELAPEVAARCLAFVRSYGLAYSAMDLIVTPQDEYVFLENNPTGQFYYIQQLVPQFDLLGEVADRLISEAACRN
jgi:glutathione synthase/RimK-type ligase-like ATP-grasp enzyme